MTLHKRHLNKGSRKCATLPVTGCTEIEIYSYHPNSFQMYEKQ